MLYRLTQYGAGITFGLSPQGTVTNEGTKTMFHADFYELGAVLDRATTRAHLLNLPKCAVCGDDCCPDYKLGADYESCLVCGEYGTPAVIVDGVAVCWDRCD